MKIKYESATEHRDEFPKVAFPGSPKLTGRLHFIKEQDWVSNCLKIDLPKKHWCGLFPIFPGLLRRQTWPLISSSSTRPIQRAMLGLMPIFRKLFTMSEPRRNWGYRIFGGKSCPNTSQIFPLTVRAIEGLKKALSFFGWPAPFLILVDTQKILDPSEKRKFPSKRRISASGLDASGGF